MSVSFKKLNIFLIFFLISFTQAQKEQCNKRLLQNFGLDGLWNKDNAKDSMICLDIKAADNCCSEVDEIKIVKLWNDYSLPKINKFRDDSILAAKKILNVAPFIKSLNVREIQYHAESLIWKKQQEKKCFNGKYFVTDTKLKEMIKDQELGDSWYTIWAKRAIYEIINKIIYQVQQKNLMQKKDLFRYVVDPLYQNKDIFNAMMDVRDNYYLYNNKTKIIDTIVQIFNSVNKIYFNQKVLDQQSISNYVRNTIEIKKIVYEVIDYDLPNKEIRVIKDHATDIQMNKLLTRLKQNQKSIIAFKAINDQTRQHFINRLVDFLQEDRELKYMLSFAYWPLTFDKLNENYKILKEINARFVRAISYVAERVSLGGVNKFTFLQHVIKNLETYLDIPKILQEDLYKIILPFMIVKMMPPFRSFVYNKLNHYHFNETRWKGNLINKIPIEKLRRHFWGKLTALQYDRRRKYHELMSRMNNLSGKLVLNLPYYKSLHDLRAPIVKAMKQAYKQGVASLKRTERPHGAISYLGSLQTRVATQLNYLLMRDAYVEIKDDKKVCAVIVRHDLFRKIHFNKKKFDHCQKMYKEFNKLDSEQLLLPIEDMKQQLEKLNNMKKGFYCDICNKKSQKFIDIDKKQFIYSEQFCFDLLTEFKSYIEWKNSKFIEFLSTTYQYMQCYATDGTETQLPYQFIGEDHLKDVKLVKECGNVKKAEDVKKCKKLCQNFDYVHYSNFFDGEKQFLERMYTLILNVVRKHGFKFQVLEKIQTGKEPHYNSNITIEDLEKDLVTEKKMIDTFDSGQTKNEFIKRSIISTIKKKEVKKDEKKDTKKDEKKDTKKDEKKDTKKDEKKDTKKDEKKDTKKDEKKDTKKDEKKDTKKGRILSLINSRKRTYRNKRRLKVKLRNKDYIDAFSREKQLVRVRKWDTLRGEWTYEYMPYKKAERIRKLKEVKKEEKKEEKKKEDEKKIEELKAKVLASDELQKIIQEIDLQIKNKHKASKIIEHFKTVDKNIYHDIPKSFIKKIVDNKNIDESELKKVVVEIQKVKVEILEKEKKEKEKKEWEQKYKDLFLPPLPKIQLIQTIYDGGDKIVKFTKPNYAKYDEINLQDGTYQQKEANIYFKSFTVLIQEKGLNPSQLVFKTNFTKDVLQQIWRSDQTKDYENLNKDVLRDYLIINKDDLAKFNSDVNLNMTVNTKEVIKSLRPKPKIDKKKDAKTSSNNKPTDQKNQNTSQTQKPTQTTPQTQQPPQTTPQTQQPAQQTQQAQPAQQSQSAQQTPAQTAQKRLLKQNSISSKDFYSLIVKLLF